MLYSTVVQLKVKLSLFREKYTHLFVADKLKGHSFFQSYWVS